MATQKFTNFANFLKMHSDITAVTAQSNKIALNEARQLCAARAILQKKKKMSKHFGSLHTFKLKKNTGFQFPKKVT